MSWWWPFGSSSPKESSASEFDAAVPPPPGGATVAPPTPPKSLQGPTTEFKGFTPPPTSPSSAPSGASKGFLDSFKTAPKSDYNTEDYSRYTSPVRESSGLNDQKYITQGTHQYITNPRVRQCLESIKMGMKLGGSVGAIFGGLTGLYAAVVHRSPLLLPVSIVGGSCSFGFFLGCGMLVRCESVNDSLKQKKIL